MTNRLKAYVRRTILNAAREYAYPKARRTADSTHAACSDATRGTDTGWWSDLIYTAPMLDMAYRYRAGIIEAMAEYADTTGEQYRPAKEPGQLQCEPQDIYAAMLRRWTWEDYRGENGQRKEAMADAALQGLRFAVEWYAGEVASELCPDF